MLSTDLVQTGLPIKEHDITVDDMSLYDVTNPETIRNCTPITKLEIFLEPIAASSHIVRPGVYIATIPHSHPQLFYVKCCNTLRIRQNLGNAFRYSDFINTQVWVWRDDSTTREVDTLSGEISTKAALLSFETLTEPTNGLLPHLRGYAWELRVDVHRNGQL